MHIVSYWVAQLAKKNTIFFFSYAIDQGRTKAIDQMQQEYKCCGAVRFEDWRQSLWISDQSNDLLFPPEDRVVPDSCCITPTDLCGLRDHPSNIYYTVIALAPFP